MLWAVRSLECVLCGMKRTGGARLGKRSAAGVGLHGDLLRPFDGVLGCSPALRSYAGLVLLVILVMFVLIMLLMIAGGVGR